MDRGFKYTPELPEKLKGLWTGEWPWMPCEGVGLRLEGLPNDMTDFIRVMAWEGCHPEATDRILSRIRQNGFDQLTVMSRLNFRWLKSQLTRLGITMTIIPPQLDWEERFAKSPFPEHLIPKNHYPEENEK